MKKIFLEGLNALWVLAVVLLWNVFNGKLPLLEYPAFILFWVNLILAGCAVAVMTVLKFKLDKRKKVFQYITLTTVAFISLSTFPKWYVLVILYLVCLAIFLIFNFCRERLSRRPL